MSSDRDRLVEQVNATLSMLERNTQAEKQRCDQLVDQGYRIATHNMSANGDVFIRDYFTDELLGHLDHRNIDDGWRSDWYDIDAITEEVWNFEVQNPCNLPSDLAEVISDWVEFSTDEAREWLKTVDSKQ